MTETASIDDPFEGFEVESGSEKEFLIANLRNDAPEEDVQEFICAWKPSSLASTSNVRDWDTNMDQADFEETVLTALSASVAEIDARIYELILTEQDENGQTPLPSLEYPAPYLILQKRVEEFARSHVFLANKHAKHTTLQRRDFARDIYDYARAIGMGRNQAKVEVQRARAAYRHNRDLVGGLMLDESDDESTLGLEINDAAEYIAAMTNGMQYGPVDPAGALDEIRRLQAKSLDYKMSSRKRKRKRAVLEPHPNKVFATAAEAASSDASRREFKRQKRRERKRLEMIKNTSSLDLGQHGGSMKSRSDGQPSSHLSPESIRLQADVEDFADIAQNSLSSSEGGDPIRSFPKDEQTANMGGSIDVNDVNALRNGVEESWDLRQKKKKKRKRKPVDQLSKINATLDDETLVKPHHENGEAEVPSEQVHTNLNKKAKGRREKRTKHVKANHKASSATPAEDLKDHHS